MSRIALGVSIYGNAQIIVKVLLNLFTKTFTIEIVGFEKSIRGLIHQLENNEARKKWAWNKTQRI